MTNLLTVLLLALLAFFDLAGQNLLQDGNQWNIKDGPGFGSPNVTTRLWQVEGDSVVNGLDYKKVYFANNPYDENFELSSLYRDDNEGRIYELGSDSSEYLIYDFGVSINDTIYLRECEAVVIEIDSIEIASGERRKRLKLNYVTNSIIQNSDFWIEGVGSVTEVFMHIGNCYQDFIMELLCFYNNDELIYQPNNSNCIISNVDEIIVREKIEIFPNPSKDWIQIANSRTKFEFFEIYNIIENRYLLELRSEI